MTKLQEFLKWYNIYSNKTYINQPEIAENLHKYIKSIGKLYPTQGSNTTKWVMGIMNVLGMTTSHEGEKLIEMLVAKTDSIRAEYDEEWVEYGFLAIEDGGRGIEF